MTDPRLSGVDLRGAVDLSSLTAPAANPRAGGAPTAPGAAAPVTSLVVEGTDANFAEFMELSARVPVVVDLWAEWCEPCKQLSPVLEKVVRDYGGRLLLVTVDVDANPGLAQAFQAQSIPTIVALLGGRPVPLFTGAVPEDQVRQVFDQLLQIAEQSGVSDRLDVAEDAAATEPADAVEAPLPPLHQEAFDAIGRGDYPAAIDAYKRALAQQPADHEAVAGLAQVELLHRLGGKTLDAIRTRAALEPQSLEAQLDVADLDLSGGHIEDAFVRLLEAFPAQDADGRSLIRERMLSLFEVVGVTDPRVIRARQSLTNLLFS